jgi:hypothetical protein
MAFATLGANYLATARHAEAFGGRFMCFELVFALFCSLASHNPSPF